MNKSMSSRCKACGDLFVSLDTGPFAITRALSYRSPNVVPPSGSQLPTI